MRRIGWSTLVVAWLATHASAQPDPGSPPEPTPPPPASATTAPCMQTYSPFTEQEVFYAGYPYGGLGRWIAGLRIHVCGYRGGPFDVRVGASAFDATRIAIDGADTYGPGIVLDVSRALARHVDIGLHLAVDENVDSYSDTPSSGLFPIFTAGVRVRVLGNLMVGGDAFYTTHACSPVYGDTCHRAGVLPGFGLTGTAGTVATIVGLVVVAVVLVTHPHGPSGGDDDVIGTGHPL